MARLIAGLFLSLDGVAEAPGPGEAFGRAGWSMPYFVKEIGEWNAHFNRENGGLLFGRVTYQAFRHAFEASGQGHPSAAIVNNARKLVVSNTLQRAEWVNSTLVQGDIGTELRRLKAQAERDLHIRGSLTLVQSLLADGLIDGLELMVFPVIVGEGRRLFPQGFSMGLRLLESKPFSSGAVLLSYALDDLQKEQP